MQELKTVLEGFFKNTGSGLKSNIDAWVNKYKDWNGGNSVWVGSIVTSDNNRPGCLGKIDVFTMVQELKNIDGEWVFVYHPVKKQGTGAPGALSPSRINSDKTLFTIRVKDILEITTYSPEDLTIFAVDYKPQSVRTELLFANQPVWLETDGNVARFKEGLSVTIHKNHGMEGKSTLGSFELD